MRVHLAQKAETKARSLFDLIEASGPLGSQPNLLARLTPEDRRLVLSQVRAVKLRPKETLFHQGEWQIGIFIIETGQIRTFYTSPTGREITLAYWKPGNFVGGPDVFGESLHMWSGMSVGSTKVFMLRSPDLRSLMLKIPELALGVVEALVYKGKCFSSLIQMLGTRSVAERLAQLLLTLVDSHGQADSSGGIAITKQFTHEDLAHMVGASRVWVTTTLDQLQRRGAIRIRKRQVVVMRPDLLVQA
ncbi:MAG: Crp/Fnr family transcriptional regulator [Pseudomonadota bacterium]|nr:Crp/Fnr family transcriptional regulator [Pseudomonadota bacterium]